MPSPCRWVPSACCAIQRTLQRGRASGFVSGLGAASADAVYGGIAGFGLASLSGLLLGWRQELRWLGGLFLLYLDWRIFDSIPTEQNLALRSTDLLGDYASTFLLTLTNPVTILAFIGIFTGLGLAAGERNFTAAGLLVLGVFLGSLLWWLLLALAVGALRQRLTPAARRWLNRAAGAVIALFGALALLG